jgi:peptidoglycan/LPS O-acetylase OafA/YrhL
MSRTSLALHNLRGFAIVMVIAFHSCIAYLSSQPASPPPFDDPPYRWLANPIIDNAHWLGLDLFCAFQYMYLMHLMFFLSGVFVYPSLSRKGPARFVFDRLVRLGIPFVLGVFLLMPLAYYPVYRVTAVDPTWSAFWFHWRALPFWPSGPLWFLSVLFACNLAFAALAAAIPGLRERLATLSAGAGTHPERFLAGLFVVAALAYVPLSMAYKPWDWVTYGPFAFQPSFIAPYAIFYLAGVCVSAHGFDRGLLAADGALARRWPIWLVGAFAAFLIWIIPTALIVKQVATWMPGLQIVADLGSVLASATISLAVTALFLRFVAAPSPILGRISVNAYPIYFMHYLFVIWLQYCLLGTDLFAVVKAALVFAGTLLMSWAVAALLSNLPFGARLLQGKRESPGFR